MVVNVPGEVPLKITFDLALDGAGWPGPLHGAAFVYGETWVGPMGLLGLLETRLGLGGRFDGSLQRACRLARDLRAQSDSSSYWRRSFEVDPVATCLRLLRDRDQLRMWGWSGQAVSPRLAALHAATETASPGIPDRLRAVERELGRDRTGHSLGIDQVATHTRLADLPPAWTAIFSSMRRAGVAVEERRLEIAPALGDLAAARVAKYQPVGDGRLCLLRRQGPLDLADEIAASIAACDSLEGIVIIGADSVLEQALVRHGLPRSGVSATVPASSRLLALVLEAAFHPMEMEDLHALLTIDPGPVPRAVASSLIGALRKSPGRRSPDWQKALAVGLGRLDEPAREGVERRVGDLLMPVCGRDEALSGAALRSRLDALSDWARRRAPHAPSLLVLLGQIASLLEAVGLLGEQAFSRQVLRRLCDDLGEVSWSRSSSQVGLAHVARPGAILGPARSIVWWNFSRETALRPERLLLTRAERDGLRTAGAAPPDPSRAMSIEVESWRRPLTQAMQSLVLACAHTNESGGSNHPHPLWDDLTASLADFGSARTLEHARMLHLAPARSALSPLRAPVKPIATAMVASPLSLRDPSSPTSIQQLLGCSMAWALNYHAHLHVGLAAPLPHPAPPLFGSLAHHILAKVLNGPVQEPETVAAQVETLFDSESTQICEALALPQHQADRAMLRRTIVDSARELVRLAAQHGVRTMMTEVPRTMGTPGQTISGRLDLVWEAPPVVIDLKWGKRTYVDEMETGTAIQIAAYAAMSEIDGQRPETAYFVLLTQQLLAEPGGRLAAGATMTGAHTSSEVWSAALSSMQIRRDELAAGRLEAPGALGASAVQVEPGVSPTLRLAPPCRYCDFGALCGRSGAL
jgi:hypothetical protein